MTDKPVWDALVLNADVTSDVHIQCRAEIERLTKHVADVERVYAEGFDSVQRDAYKIGLEESHAEVERLTRDLEAAQTKLGITVRAAEHQSRELEAARQQNTGLEARIAGLTNMHDAVTADLAYAQEQRDDARARLAAATRVVEAVRYDHLDFEDGVEQGVYDNLCGLCQALQTFDAAHESGPGACPMIDRDPRAVMVELAARIERMEAMMVLLCEEARQGQGQMGKSFRQFIDDWRREHSG